MLQTPDEVRPAKLWRSMPTELKIAAATAFWTDEQAALERAEAVSLIAQHLKFRPKSVLAMPVEKKARHLASRPQLSDLLAARLLVSYHLTHQRAMMGTFLDELGIKHQDGLIDEDSPPAPDPAVLDRAVATLRERFPADEVARYFWTLLWQDAETWAGLRDRPELSLDQTTAQPANG